MSDRPVTDVAASVRARLLNRSRESGEDPQDLFIRYALERFLYRLSESEHRASFLLKGATLFAVWEADPHRPTRDIDLLGFGDDLAERLQEVFADVCGEAVQDDGMMFDEQTIDAREIREGQSYGGKRIVLASRLGTMRIKVQVDVGFGDAVARPEEEVTMPVLLDFPPPTLRTYPAEAVIAEKLHAMVQHGMLNSRMKDVYDVVALAARLEFDGARLTDAIRLTFERRGTTIGVELPTPATKEFADDSVMRRRWDGFLRRNRVEVITVDEAVDSLRGFLLEPWATLAADRPCASRWPAGGPWGAPSESSHHSL